MSIRSALTSFAAEIRQPGLTSLELRTGSNPLENPAVSLNSPVAWQWLSQSEPTAAAEIINDATALKITTVYGCVRIIAESVASLPLLLFEEGQQGRTEAKAHPLYRLLKYLPNPEMTAYTFWETYLACLALTGNAYAEIEFAKNGTPIALWPLHPNKTTPKRKPDGTIVYVTSDGTNSPGEQREIPA